MITELITPILELLGISLVPLLLLIIIIILIIKL